MGSAARGDPGSQAANSSSGASASLRGGVASGHAQWFGNGTGSETAAHQITFGARTEMLPCSATTTGAVA